MKQSILNTQECYVDDKRYSINNYTSLNYYLTQI